MPGDIRSFFGGKKSTKKDASPSPTENKSSKMNTIPQITKKTTPITSPLKKKKESVSKRKRVLMDDDEYDVESSGDEMNLDDEEFLSKLEKEIDSKEKQKKDTEIAKKRRKVEETRQDKKQITNPSTYFSSGTSSKYFDESLNPPELSTTSSFTTSSSIKATEKSEKKDDMGTSPGKSKHKTKLSPPKETKTKTSNSNNLPTPSSNMDTKSATSMYDAKSSTANYEGNFKPLNSRNRYIEVGPPSDLLMPSNRPLNLTDLGLHGKETPQKELGKSNTGKKNKKVIEPEKINELWSDKYKPNLPSDLVGSTDIVNKLTRWFQQWDNLHRLKIGWNKIGKSKENEGAKAALLSGPPGIGKSSTARIVANYLGYTVFELNASDTRNKKTLENELKDVLGNTALKGKTDSVQVNSSGISSSHSKEGEVDFSKGVNRKRVIIMDEVDGMSGSDRGGMQELIKLIKTSKIPIITICNDRQSTKVRSLANYCYDLRFRRPNKLSVEKRMSSICAKEGLHISKDAIDRLVESCGNDIRQILNTLQMMHVKRSRSDSISEKDVLDKLSVIEKDKTLRLSPFEATAMMINGAPRVRNRMEENLSLNDRYNYFFIDYSLVPLLMEQSYIDSIRNDQKIKGSEKLERLEKASTFVSDMDLVSSMIMGGDQHWELLPLHAMLTVAVGQSVKGWIAYPQFPQWLGKNSSRNKKKRLLSDLTLHLHGGKLVSGTSDSIRQDYFPVLREKLANLVEKQDAVGIVDFLDLYGMSKDDAFESFPELFLSTVKGNDDLKDRMDSKFKASLTREYNKRAHMNQALAETQTLGGKKKKIMPKEEEGIEGEGDDNDQGAEEEEQEEDIEELKKMFAAKKRGGAKGGTTSTKGKKETKGGKGKKK